jgi:putative hydrolase of the HAD superfamily
MSRAAAFAAVTTVTFDAGGTLLHPHPGVGAVYHACGARHGCTHDPDTLERAFRRAFVTVSRDAAELDPEARERDFWRRVVAATFAGDPGLSPAALPALFAELWEAFAHGRHWRVPPAAATTLGTLRARGYRLGVLSNWDHRLHQVLAETGLARWFEHVLISSELGAEKPDPEIFHAAAARFAAAPAQCLHIGDSIRHDREGAHAAGWSAVIVRREDGCAGGEHDILALDDLLELLPGCSAAGPARAKNPDVLHSSRRPGEP